MEHTQDFIVPSLELHLFFARIMKEHALFLKAGFLPHNACLASEAEGFLRQFGSVLSRAVALSGGVVRRRVLESGEIFMPFTCRAEWQPQRLTGTFIDRSLTAWEKRLRGWDCQDELRASRGLACQVRHLIRHALSLVNRLTAFKNGCCAMWRTAACSPPIVLCSSLAVSI